METVINILQGFSGLAFLGYGIACLCFGGMEAEFERYGLLRFRRWVGSLEILGGLGLLLGFYVSAFSILASAGLTALMIMGVLVRWRLQDTWAQMSPAVVLGGLNLLIFLHRIGLIV